MWGLPKTRHGRPTRMIPEGSQQVRVECHLEKYALLFCILIILAKCDPRETPLSTQRKIRGNLIMGVP